MSIVRFVERFRAVAFDLDGTLIDTAADLADAVNQMLAQLGAPTLTDARVRSLIGNGVEQLVARALDESLGASSISLEHRAAALTLFRQRYAERLFNRSKVFPGVVAALQSLSILGTTLCCVTNKDRQFAEPLLEKAGLHGFLEFILCPASAEERKPSPNMLYTACARMGITTAEMLYVGDSGIDVATARAAGCAIVLVSYGYDRTHSDAQPDSVIETMTDLLTL